MKKRIRKTQKKESKPSQKQKSKNNLYIILGAILVLLIAIIIILFLMNNSKPEEETNNEDKVIENTQEGVIGDKELEGLKLTKTSLIYKDGISTLETTVTNNTDSSYYLEEFHIIVKDENGNDIINYNDEDGELINYLVGYAGVEIPAKGSTKIETSIDFDISSAAYTISYEIVK